MKVTAKFTASMVGQYAYLGAKRVELHAVYGTTPENVSFAEATPSGSIELHVNNPAVDGFFEPGAEYYVTFERAEAPAVAQADGGS